MLLCVCIQPLPTSLLLKAAVRRLSSCGRKFQEISLGKGVFVNSFDKNDLLALEKPCHVLSHPNGVAASPRALVNSPYCAEKEAYTVPASASDGTDYPLYLLNRLDSATSGVLLLSANKAVAASVRAQFSERAVKKRYIALVFGHLAKNAEIWRSAVVVRRSKEGEVRLSNSSAQTQTRTQTTSKAVRGKKAAGAKEAVTRVRVLKRLQLRLPALTDQDTSTATATATAAAAATSFLPTRVRIPMSVVELQPVTGYTHQLRFQCAERGSPIVGDRTYGNFTMNKKVEQMAAAVGAAAPGAVGTPGSTAGAATGSGTQDSSDLLESMRKESRLRLFLHCHQISLSYHHLGQKHKFATSSQTLDEMLPPSLLKHL